MNLVRELVKKKLIDKKTASLIEEEVKFSGRNEEEIILEKEIVSEDSLFQLKSDVLEVPLTGVYPDEIDLETLEIIPEESARYYKMTPILKKEEKISIGMVYPEDLKAREALEFLARQNDVDYKIFLITLTDFEKVLKRYRTLKKEVGKALEEFEEEAEKRTKKKKGKKEDQLEKIVEEAPISKAVAVILRHAVDGGASDVHIEPGKKKVRVRFRLDGDLYSSLFLPLKIHSAVVSRIKILCGLKIDETRIPQDGRFSTKIGGNDVDFRVSTMPTTLGEKVVIRILNSGERKVDFESLGIVGRNLEVIKRMLKKPFGMALATGPTGSGKSTTLYSILGLLNKEDRNLITLEDPVEYFIEGINQSQVNPEVGYTFANGLRSILRQDPDILMVGEIRDEETASLAVHAALTGHVVLSTLHTSNSFGVVPRLVDMGIKKFLIPPTLRIAIAQRLVKKLCPECRKKVRPNSEIEEIIKKSIDGLHPETKKKIKSSSKDFHVYKPVGCIKCNKKGFLGRVGLYEILEMTDSIKEIINENPTEGEIEKEALKQGMTTIRQDGILKALDGITTIEEVLRTTEEN